MSISMTPKNKSKNKNKTVRHQRIIPVKQLFLSSIPTTQVTTKWPALPVATPVEVASSNPETWKRENSKKTIRDAYEYMLINLHINKSPNIDIHTILCKLGTSWIVRQETPTSYKLQTTKQILNLQRKRG